MPHRLDQREDLFVRMQVLLDLLDHLVNELTEERSVQTLKQGSRHFQPLLTVVISIIFSASTQGTGQQAVDHIADEVGLLLEAIGVG